MITDYYLPVFISMDTKRIEHLFLHLICQYLCLNDHLEFLPKCEHQEAVISSTLNVSLLASLWGLPFRPLESQEFWACPTITKMQGLAATICHMPPSD